jgi:hypothetical protein
MGGGHRFPAHACPIMPTGKAKRPILDGVEAGSINELGLWLPPGALEAAGETEHPALRHTSTYLTLSEYLASRGHENVEVSEPEIIELLGRALGDCIGHIAQLSAKMEFADGPYFSAAVQRVLLDDVFGAESEAGVAIAKLLKRKEPTVVICLLGVNDLLDAGLAIEDPAEQLSWQLRQCGVDHHEDQLPVRDWRPPRGAAGATQRALASAGRQARASIRRSHRDDDGRLLHPRRGRAGPFHQRRKGWQRTVPRSAHLLRQDQGERGRVAAPAAGDRGCDPSAL